MAGRSRSAQQRKERSPPWRISRSPPAGPGRRRAPAERKTSTPNRGVSRGVRRMLQGEKAPKRASETGPAPKVAAVE